MEVDDDYDIYGADGVKQEPADGVDDQQAIAQVPHVELKNLQEDDGRIPQPEDEMYTHWVRIPYFL